MKENQYKGTQTEKNLMAAFAGESEARNKYTYFASKAKKDGYEQIAALFLKTAENEKEHAKLWFKELNGIRGYKICPKCDAEVNERFQFCGRCGARLPDVEDEDFMSLEPNDYYTESSNNFFNADSNQNY